MTLEYHQFANLFPLMEGAALEELTKSIKEEGQQDLIILYEDKILDGRNRYRACLAAGVLPITEKLPSNEDPLRYVIRKNLTRRHLTDLDRGHVAAQLATMTVGNPNLGPIGSSEPIGPALVTADEAAELLHVSRPALFRWKTVMKHAPEQIAAIKAGEVSLSAVAEQIRRGPDDKPKKQSKAAERRELDKRADNQRAQKARANIWGNLRDGLDNLMQLPLPADVVVVVRKLPNAKALGAIVDRRLDKSIKWLEEFRNAWKDAG